ncbi:hypothetical protein [Comamonas guangdongensis]|uniref:Uncharacterized protein n=1 Tax=Comamonas guangdongensis TaxID=510515 RepID=A0ABV3ZZX1_9BURK
MKRKKQRISLFEFLKTGHLGSFAPCRNLSLAALTAIFGRPDCVETRDGIPYEVESPECFPVIACYGTLEFHFDSGKTLYCIFCDAFVSGAPSGGLQIRFSDAALLRRGRAMSDFLAHARARGLSVQPECRPGLLPYARVLTTSGGVELGFEVDDPEDTSEMPTLRWFSWMAGS